MATTRTTQVCSTLERGASGFVDVAERCIYIPRGHPVDEGAVCASARLAVRSRSTGDRTPGKSWWPEEVTTTADLETLGTAPVDVLVSPEGPAGAPLEGFRLPAEDQVRTDEVRTSS